MGGWSLRRIAAAKKSSEPLSEPVSADLPNLWSWSWSSSRKRKRWPTTWRTWCCRGSGWWRSWCRTSDARSTRGCRTTEEESINQCTMDICTKEDENYLHVYMFMDLVRRYDHPYGQNLGNEVEHFQGYVTMYLKIQMWHWLKKWGKRQHNAVQTI